VAVPDEYSIDQIKWTQSFTGVRIKSGGTPGANDAGASSDAPGGAAPGPISGLVGKIDDAKKQLANGKKTLEALTNPKTPTFSDDHLNTDSPRTRFLDDMKTGIAKSKEYIGYINTVTEQAEKYGKGIEGVGKAAGELAKISGKLKGGLGKVGGTVEKAKQISAWLDALENFAGDCQEMDPKDGDSVQKWSDSFQHLWNVTAPFIDWLKSKAAAAAFADGSIAAATLSVVLTGVTVELVAAGQVLSAGVKNVNAYFKRLHELDAASQRDAEGRPPPEDPAMPEPWEDTDDREEKDRQHAEFARQEKEYARERQAAEAKQEQQRRLAEQFESGPFVKIYKAHRKDFMAAILAALRKGGKEGGPDGTSPEYKWWDDCLLPDDTAGEVTTPEDPEKGIQIDPRKANVSDDDAAYEIQRFREANPPCPFFDRLYQAELKKFQAQTSKGEHAGAHH
jgi:hypothetical protein